MPGGLAESVHASTLTFPCWGNFQYGVFPAHAGMAPWAMSAPMRIACVPRACGDGPADQGSAGLVGKVVLLADDVAASAGAALDDPVSAQGGRTAFAGDAALGPGTALVDVIACR